MAAHAVRLEHGQLQVVRAAPPEDPDELRRAAAALGAAAGAGAVEIIDLVDDGNRVELVLAYAGRPVAGPLPAVDVARLGAALARSLAALHERGLAHGAVRADHVLVDAHGAVRLCGFAPEGDAATDVRQLGALLLSLLDEREHGATVETVRAAATRCVVDDVEGRPSTTAIAASLAAIRASARSGGDVGRRGPRRHLALGTAAVLGVVLVVTVAAQRPPAGSVSDPPPVTTPATASTSSATTTAEVAAGRVWPPAIEEIRVAGATWRIETSPGDRVVLGDWDCDGVRTPAIVRRSGDVFVVDELPATGAAPARYVTTIPGPIGASVERRDGCDHLAVATAGRRISVRLRPGPAA